MYGSQFDHRLMDRVIHDATGNTEFARHILGFSAIEFDRFKDHKNSWRDLFSENTKEQGGASGTKSLIDLPIQC